jgi:outer membrane protein
MKRTIVSLLLLSISSFLFAQEEWSLKKCIEHAIENSIDIYQSEIRIQDAGVLTKLSEHQKYPNVSLSSNVGLNLGRSVDPTTNTFITQSFFSNGYGVGANVLLFGSGRIKNGVKQSEWEERASIEDKNAMIDQITVNVVTSFFNILFSRDNLLNTEVQLKTINDQIDQMQKLISAGARPEFEIYDLNAQKATIEQQLAQTQNQIDLAYINLKALLNLPLNYEMTITNPPAEQATYTNLDLSSIEDIYNRVLGRQASVKAIENRLNSAKIGVDIAKAQLYPTVGLNINARSNFSNQFKEIDGFSTRTIESPVRIDGQNAIISTDQQVPNFVNTPYFSQIDQNFSYGFGLSLNVPIYNNYQSKSGIERSKLNVENLIAEKDKNNLAIRNTVGTLYTDARASRKNLEAAQRTLEARQIAFNNAEKRFNLGAINTYDYLNTQDLYRQAQTSEIIARYDYALRIKLLDFYQGYPVTLE